MVHIHVQDELVGNMLFMFLVMFSVLIGRYDQWTCVDMDFNVGI